MIKEMIMAFLAMFASAPTASGPGWEKNTTVTVSFISPADMDLACGWLPPPGMTTLACVDKIGGKHVYLPNPCLFKDHDAYARLACHEMAHTNYWRHEYK